MLDALDRMPRMGWVEPSRVTDAPDVAAELGLAWLGFKRDDELPGLYGGTKVRKLDTLLAAPPLCDAATWVSVGAIGSGHLATLAAAAQALDRHVVAHVFWEPNTPGVVDNLAFTAAGPTTLRYHGGKIGIALAAPLALARTDRATFVPPGATTPLGVLGVVRGGLELATQVRDGLLPEPDRCYVPLGSTGTAAGLALGLALGGLRTQVFAVSVVPRWMSPTNSVRSTISRTNAALAALGVNPVPAAVTMVRGHLGRGYGEPTADGTRWVERLADLPLEHVYSAKAMAGLAADPTAAGTRVLFWVTPHRHLPPPPEGWRDRLPAALARSLAAHRTGGWTRRHVLAGAGVGAAVLLGAGATRIGLYSGLADWEGEVLSRWEALVVAAAAEAILPDEPGGPLPAGPSLRDLVANVDRYLVGMPPDARRDIHLMMVVLEHGTMLGFDVLRLTRLDPASRRAFLETLRDAGGPLAQAARGIRDLVYLGWYQDSETWGPLAYDGPMLPGAPRDYDELVAKPGQTP